MGRRARALRRAAGTDPGPVGAQGAGKNWGELSLSLHWHPVLFFGDLLYIDANLKSAQGE